jgi:hypothetical protein
MLVRMPHLLGGLPHAFALVKNEYTSGLDTSISQGIRASRTLLFMISQIYNWNLYQAPPNTPLGY